MSVCANCKLHSKEVYVNKNRFRKITMNPFSFPLKKMVPQQRGDHARNDERKHSNGTHFSYHVQIK